MHRLLAAALTCVVAAGLAVGTGFGIVAALNATPEQPNVPLVHFHSSPDELPDHGGSAPPSASPSRSASPSKSAAESPDAQQPEDSDGADGGDASPSAPPGSADDSPDSSRDAAEPSASAAAPGE
ncbi:hypothetical protein ACQEU8_29300 [Streptomyces sp. CA-250714]|uniref:hypothetical protein n=1 Tax=Streptomyces sp. CA-250714 TaxID=3240060 RepID=UPI003D8C7EBE